MTHDPDLAQLFRRALREPKGDGFVRTRAAPFIFAYEMRREPAEYIWDGMRRGEDPEHPHMVFQATLSGWGSYEQGGREWKVGPESGFFTIIPSHHLYRLPPESDHWEFFWFNSGHPWVVERISELAARHPPVFALPCDSKLMATSRSLFENAASRRWPDGFAEECALLEWMMELERHMHELAHPKGPREAMLGKLRAFTLAHLSRSFGMEEFARQQGMSRSHYSRRFARVTGLSPAAYVLQLRLEEARRRIRETADPLKTIAAATGFADSNHFCKVFRQHYHLSPGVYRKQFRG